MSADGVAAVVSGVDLALVSWMDGPVVDLSSVSGQPRSHEHQRIGRCLCAKDAAAAESEVAAQQNSVPQLKSTLKKQQQQQQQHRPAPSTSYSASKSPSIDRHIVPQVVQVVSQRTKQHGQVSNSSSTTAGSVEKGGQQQQQQPLEASSNRTRINRANTSATTSLPAGHPTKPILSRKNWNNTIDSSPHQQQHHHQPSCLRRYGSQQSCKSATTLRSYVTSTSRGNFKVNECNKIFLLFFSLSTSSGRPIFRR